ncbi:hypothetical protein TSOC_014757, partial [Tetrabaena socialis]
RLRDAIRRIVAATPRYLTSRLERLTGAGKAAKTHTYFLLAGPIGSYLIASSKLDDKCAENAYLKLVQACGDLWQKEIHTGNDTKADEVAALRTRVVQAICLAEKHLSVNELDVKLHNLLHLVDNIYNMVSPLYASSMFQPESIWGKLSRWAHSKVHMEACMFFCSIDREATMHLHSLAEALAKQASAADTDPGTVSVSMWQPDQFLAAAILDTPTGRVLEELELGNSDLVALKAFYQHNLSDLAPADVAAAVAAVTAQVKKIGWAWAGPMELHAGVPGGARPRQASWFMPRPDHAAGNVLWFGQVEGMYVHASPMTPEGGGGDKVLIKTKWYPATIDTHLRCPVIKQADASQNRWWDLQDVVPWEVWPLPHPSAANQRIVMARHWHILHHLPPYPTV